MTRRRFPRSPNVPAGPFDADHNPFADEITTPVSSNDNPLAAPTCTEVQPFVPVDYEQTQFDRSSRTLSLAGFGAAFVAASLVIAVVVAIRSSPFTTELVYCLPTNLLGLALSLPAWIAARADWRAIEAGVMADTSRQRTRIAWWVSFLATWLGTIPFFGVLVAIVGSLFA
jgi:hypothetical protein